jgi:hypothetical protein
VSFEIHLCFLHHSLLSGNGKMIDPTKRKNIFRRIFLFYLEGFRSMTWGRKLWIIILVKLFIMFAILRIFFFQDFLGSRFGSDKQKSEYVIDELTKRDLK